MITGLLHNNGEPEFSNIIILSTLLVAGKRYRQVAIHGLIFIFKLTFDSLHNKLTNLFNALLTKPVTITLISYWCLTLFLQCPHSGC